MKLPYPFLRLPINFDAARLQSEISSLPGDAWRPHPQGFAGNSAVTLISRDGNPGSDELFGQMRPTPWLGRHSYLMEVLTSFGAVLGRTRLMRLSPGAEVTRHVDSGYYWRQRMRIHVPVITEPSVVFECGEEKTHMSSGECWIFDTWRQHRVSHSGTIDRVHLVCDTVGGVGLAQLIKAAEDRSAFRAPSIQNAAIPEFESHNAPEVMSPWELMFHVEFYVSESISSPQADCIALILNDLCNQWSYMWAAHGPDPAYRARYTARLQETWSALKTSGLEQVVLKNGTRLDSALKLGLFSAAIRR